MANEKKNHVGLGAILSVLSISWILPILIVLVNSFKNKIWINDEPFKLPNAETFSGFLNYVMAMKKYGFLEAVGWTVFITVVSVILILVCLCVHGM